MATPARLLILSHDMVGRRMAGPGIRYYHLARVLANFVPTTLAAPHDPDLTSSAPPLASKFELVRYDPADWSTLAPHLAQTDVCFVPGAVADQFAALPQRPPFVVVDGYDPLLAEWLALPSAESVETRMAAWWQRLQALNHQYTIGDLYLCASERQRDWWLGLLEANGRLNPATFAADASLRNLIDVLPFGLPEQPAQQSRAVIKGVWPGIGVQDKVLLWGGGLWPWLDPITAIRAVGRLWTERQDLRLVFPGTKHPNPAVDGMPTANERAREVAAEVGLLDKAVFFGDWVPYEDWVNVLLESDLALSLHFDTFETRLAFRSRVLEYIWAGLPMIATGGDATSELLQTYDLGMVTPEADVEAVAGAIRTLLAEPRTQRQANFAQAQAALTWERAAAPLIAYCRQPWQAADRRITTPGSSVFQLNNELTNVRRERDHWRDLAHAYANGRVMRLLRWLQRA